MLKCGGCGKFISTQDGAKCNKCSGVFHRACVNIPERVRVMSSTWICPTCKATLSNELKVSTPVGEKTARSAEDPAHPQVGEQGDCSSEILVQPINQDFLWQFQSAIVKLQAGIHDFSEKNRLLSDEIAALKVELYGTSQKLKSMESLEVEIKALRNELKQIQEKNSKTSDDFFVANMTSGLDNATRIQPGEVEQPLPLQSQNLLLNSSDFITLPGVSVANDVALGCPFSSAKSSTAAQLLASEPVILAAASQPESELQAEPWMTVISKKRRRVTVRGAGEMDEELQAVERLKTIHLWSLKASTTTDNVLCYMKKKNPVGNGSYAVEKLALKHTNYASFIVTVPESLFSFFMLGENWPLNTRVNEWFRKRTNRWYSASDGRQEATESAGRSQQ